MGLLFVRRIRLQVAVDLNRLLAAALSEQLVLGANVGVLPLRFLPRLLVGALVDSPATRALGALLGLLVIHLAGFGAR